MARSAPGASSKKRAVNSRQEKVRTKSRSASGDRVLPAISAMRPIGVAAESTMTRSAPLTSASVSGPGAPLPISTMVGTSGSESALTTEACAHRGHGPEEELDAVVADHRVALLVAHRGDVGLDVPGGQPAVDGEQERAARAGVGEVLDGAADARDLGGRAHRDEVHRGRARALLALRLGGRGPERDELGLHPGDGLAERAGSGHGRLQVSPATSRPSDSTGPQLPAS